MADNLIIALQITVIGMLFVFGAIALLWILMGALVKLSVIHAKHQEVSPSLKREHRELCARAACAAVAVALMMENESVPHEFPLPPTALVSAWQAVMRTDILRKRGRIR